MFYVYYHSLGVIIVIQWNFILGINLESRQAPTSTHSTVVLFKYTGNSLSIHYSLTLVQAVYHSSLSALFQYYYNSVTGQYLYWDAEKCTYLPAPTGTEDQTASDSQKKEEKKESKDKKEKVKVAKKIAKVTSIV